MQQVQFLVPSPCILLSKSNKKFMRLKTKAQHQIAPSRQKGGAGKGSVCECGGCAVVGVARENPALCRQNIQSDKRLPQRTPWFFFRLLLFRFTKKRWENCWLASMEGSPKERQHRQQQLLFTSLPSPSRSQPVQRSWWRSTCHWWAWLHMTLIFVGISLCLPASKSSVWAASTECWK